jgi:hypothetical protein
VSAIVMKLLAKAAEDRYQTAEGVEADLKLCQTALLMRDRIPDFSLGTRDSSDRFLIAEKLYGRQREIAQLLAAFDRTVASGRPGLMLVSGYSGVGKVVDRQRIAQGIDPPARSVLVGQLESVLGRQPPVPKLAPQDAQRAFEQVLRRLIGVFARPEHPLEAIAQRARAASVLTRPGSARFGCEPRCQQHRTEWVVPASLLSRSAQPSASHPRI